MDFRFPPLINGRELDGFPVSPPYKWEGTRWISGFPPLQGGIKGGNSTCTHRSPDQGG
jgi:hypothetical protein